MSLRGSESPRPEDSRSNPHNSWARLAKGSSPASPLSISAFGDWGVRGMGPGGEDVRLADYRARRHPPAGRLCARRMRSMSSFSVTGVLLDDQALGPVPLVEHEVALSMRGIPRP